MRELIEVLLSITAPTAVLVAYALILARREEREVADEVKPASRKQRIPALMTPDPDGHLGRVGSE